MPQGGTLAVETSSAPVDTLNDLPPDGTSSAATREQELICPSSSVTPSPHASCSSLCSIVINDKMETGVSLGTNCFSSEDTPNLKENRNCEIRNDDHTAASSSPDYSEESFATQFSNVPTNHQHPSPNAPLSDVAVRNEHLAVEPEEESVATGTQVDRSTITSDNSVSAEVKESSKVSSSNGFYSSHHSNDVAEDLSNDDSNMLQVHEKSRDVSATLHAFPNAETAHPSVASIHSASVTQPSEPIEGHQAVPFTLEKKIEPAASVSNQEQSTDGTPINDTDSPTTVPLKRAPPVVIDLLDSDDDEEEQGDAQESRTSSSNADVAQQAIVQHIQDSRKRQKMAQRPIVTTEAALASHHARAAHMPQWMKQPSKQPAGVPIQPGMSLPGPTGQYAMPVPQPSVAYAPGAAAQQPQHPPGAAIQPALETSSQRKQSLFKYNTPFFLRSPEGFVPTWEKILPESTAVKPQHNSQRRSFRLSLLNVCEFTIEGLPLTWEGPPTPISGLRKSIKSISREHGKAVYEKNREGGGRWRIPLGAYHSFLTFLKSDPLTIVEGIPQNQLQIASLERARQEKGYPTSEKLIEQGLPSGLAKALAPFQRGGVDFVLSKGGRALIADDMGLGKTIQGIAAMAMYHQEWPLLVLCPSSARYHWESEFQQWLGVDSPVNKPQCDDGDEAVSDGLDEDVRNGALLKDSQIHVLTAARDDILPSKTTRVVICSYGLAPALVESGKITPSTFPCAIVDESHMLKNKSTKRTSTLLPILSDTHRCVLLSGTPALARPAELWPQLDIIGVAKYGWWDDETEFMEKYAKSGESRRLAELHTMLVGTVMIRRLKADILKELPKKIREKAELNVLTHDQRQEFKEMMSELRQGKGALGQIAREEHAKASSISDSAVDVSMAFNASASLGQVCTGMAPADRKPAAEDFCRAMEESKACLDQQLQTELVEGRNRIHASLASHAARLSQEEYSRLAWQLDGQLLADLETKRAQMIQEIDSRFGRTSHIQNKDEQESKRTTLLSRLYERTGNVKIPLLVDMLKRWLNDPTKGKLCIFAHHISVLDAIQDMAELSNEGNSANKYIRIDGSTSPKLRQRHIKTFQTDPSTRIALLGITAAGVAVTLTASSTVWFAELFWTPAIMVQAEDRCHRIGQQARVRCLYFVAKGTIDDVLWRLIEKKFSDLGEFVEGKEKLKIVVDKNYTTLSELRDMFSYALLDEDEPGDLSDSDIGLDEDLLDPDLVHAIEALGEEERQMLRSADNEDESPDPANAESQAEVVTMLEQETPFGTQGRSEEDAIALLDDEDETHCAEAEACPSASKGRSEDEGVNGIPPAKLVTNQANLTEPTINLSSLNAFSFYKLFIPGPRLGVVVALFAGRLIVSKVSEERIKLLGADARPRVGDIFCAINEVRIPRSQDFQQLMKWLRESLNRQQGFTSCVFAEEPTFAAYYAQHHVGAVQPKAHENYPPTESKYDEVIEID